MTVMHKHEEHDHHEHDHHHDHHHHEHHGLGGHHHHSQKTSEKNLWIAFALNMSFALIELFGGIITGSTAILSDALHDFGDSLALGISALIQRLSRTQAKAKYNFGWKRLPVIGALFNIVILTISTIYIIGAAIPRLIEPQVVLSEGMVWIAIFGIVANGLAVFRMRGSKRILDRTVILHLLEDLFGWIAVLIVAIVMSLTAWYWLDPLLSLIISGIMIKNIFSHAKIVVEIILGATLDEAQKQEIAAEILALTPEIISLEKFQLWSLDGEEQVACLEIVLTKVAEQEKIVAEIRNYLQTQHIYELTIECRSNNHSTLS